MSATPDVLLDVVITPEAHQVALGERDAAIEYLRASLAILRRDGNAWRSHPDQAAIREARAWLAEQGYSEVP